jgi:hypothetical protein
MKLLLDSPHIRRLTNISAAARKFGEPFQPMATKIRPSLFVLFVTFCNKKIPMAISATFSGISPDAQCLMI